MSFYRISVLFTLSTEYTAIDSLMTALHMYHIPIGSHPFSYSHCIKVLSTAMYLEDVNRSGIYYMTSDYKISSRAKITPEGPQSVVGASVPLA